MPKCSICGVECDKSRCRACNVTYMKNWRKNHAGRVKEYNDNRIADFNRRRDRRREICKASGITAEELRLHYDRMHGCCVYCGLPVAARFSVSDPKGFDHVVPLSKGGKHELSNLVVCCHRCNSQKIDRGVDYVRPNEPAGDEDP